MGYQLTIKAISDTAETVMTAYTVQVDNTRGTVKPDNAAWCRVTVRPAIATTSCISDKNQYRVSGVLILQCFAPIGTGEATLNTAVEVAMEGFSYKNISVGDPEGTIVQFDAAYPVTLGRIQGQFQTNVNCPFNFDLTEV